MNEPLLFFPLYLADMPAVHGCPVNVDLTVHVLHINKALSQVFFPVVVVVVFST